MQTRPNCVVLCPFGLSTRSVVDEGKVDNGANERNITRIELNAAGCLVFVSLPSHILSTVACLFFPLHLLPDPVCPLAELAVENEYGPRLGISHVDVAIKVPTCTRSLGLHVGTSPPRRKANRLFCALIWWCVDLFCKQIVQCCCCWGGECKIGTRGFLKIRFTIKAASAQTVNKTSK